MHRLTRCWNHGSATHIGGDILPFLFINGGVETLSGSDLGVAIVRDAITQRETQLLEHSSIFVHFFDIALADAHISGR